MAGSSRSDIISVLKSEIADFEAKTQVNETGRIISINDGIVNIYGLNHVPIRHYRPLCRMASQYLYRKIS